MKGMTYTFSVVCILAGLAFIGLFGFTFMSQYAPFTIEKSEAVVEFKQSKIGLNYFPKYQMVVVDEESELHRRMLEVSKQEMMEYTIGETIQGYEINGRFFTWKQFLMDTVHTVIYSAVGLSLLLLGIGINMKNSKLYEQVRARLQPLKKYKQKLTGSWKYILLLAGVVILFGDNIYHAVNIHIRPYEETVAVVEEMEEQPGYGRYTGPTFRFQLAYEVNGEPNLADIKVSKELYDRYIEGSKVKIYYQQENPYYVFMPSELKWGKANSK